MKLALNGLYAVIGVKTKIYDRPRHMSVNEVCNYCVLSRTAQLSRGDTSDDTFISGSLAAVAFKLMDEPAGRIFDSGTSRRAGRGERIDRADAIALRQGDRAICHFAIYATHGAPSERSPCKKIEFRCFVIYFRAG